MLRCSHGTCNDERRQYARVAREDARAVLAQLVSGEGGALIVNDPPFIDRAEILWERAPTESNSSVELSPGGATDVPDGLLRALRRLLSRCPIVSLLGVTMSRKLSLTQSAQSVRCCPMLSKKAGVKGMAAWLSVE